MLFVNYYLGLFIYLIIYVYKDTHDSSVSEAVKWFLRIWILEYSISFSFLKFDILLVHLCITENKETLTIYFQCSYNKHCFSFKPSSLVHCHSVKINTTLLNNMTAEWGKSDGSLFIVFRLWTLVTDLLNTDSV